MNGTPGESNDWELTPRARNALIAAAVVGAGIPALAGVWKGASGVALVLSFISAFVSWAGLIFVAAMFLQGWRPKWISTPGGLITTSEPVDAGQRKSEESKQEAERGARAKVEEDQE